MPNYLDVAQREEILHLQQSFTGRTEWPSWLLLIAGYRVGSPYRWPAPEFAGGPESRCFSQRAGRTTQPWSVLCSV